MWVKILLGINILIGLITICGVGLSIYKTHILTHNHVNHLAKDVKYIFNNVGCIDKTQIEQGMAITGIQSTCKERGKQLDNLTK